MNRYKITLIVEANDLADSLSNLEDTLHDNDIQLISSNVEILEDNDD